MARKRYWAYALTGGTAGAMDAIDGAALSVGDTCEVLNQTTRSIYYLVESGNDEDSPNVIAPDSNAGDKRWEIILPTLNLERGFWADGTDGANFHRMRDRVLIGDACDFDGNETSSANSWLGDLGDGENTCIWLEYNATLASIASRGIAGMFAVRATDSPGTTGGSLGCVGYAYNNLEESGHRAWAGYFDAVRDTDGGNTFGVEIDVTNLVESPNATACNPYSTLAAGTTFGINLAAGGDATVWPTSYNCDIALHVNNNGARFKSGILFRDGALERESVTSGPAHAIMLAYDHQIEWYEYGTDTMSAYITANITDANHDQGLIFYNGGLKYVNGNDNIVFLVQDNQNTVVNYAYVAGAVAGSHPFIAVAGSDTDIDLLLAPKGAGKIMFGGYSAGALSPAGYITIKDASGNTRRLLVG